MISRYYNVSKFALVEARARVTLERRNADDSIILAVRVARECRHELLLRNTFL